MDGNKRYTSDDLAHPRRDSMHREELASMQDPFAIVVGCSDSRVPLEIIFDQGVGDLFVIRDAGNVIGPIELDSIEFAAVHLHARLILVLGHQNCGAVTAVMQGKTEEIETIASLIEPAILETEANDPDRLHKAIVANVRLSVEKLENSPVIGRLIKEGKIQVEGGYYSLTTGVVTLLGERGDGSVLRDHSIDVRCRKEVGNCRCSPLSPTETLF